MDRNNMTEDLIEPRFEGAQLIIETSNETEVYDSKYLVAALLISIAKSDGHISENETAKMLQLVGDHFQLKSSESLELLTRAMANLAENPDLTNLLKELSSVLTSADKEDVAVMLLKVVAADGRQDAEEMDTLSQAAEIIDISSESMHRAFDRYFDEKTA
jgi:uncharacterized tellurite resistance protein B-like protein